MAFLVEDAHQGRGIAQLLLEHLAEAARERGITAFVAELLPQNARMAQVFADAGYRVSKGIEDGVLFVEFPILPTDTSVGVMERREHRAEKRVDAPAADARARGRAGPGRPRAGPGRTRCCAGGFRGAVTAVSTDDADGRRGADGELDRRPSPGRIDLALVSIPTGEMGAVVIDAAHKGAHAMVVLTGTDSRRRRQPDGRQPGPGVRCPGAGSRRAGRDQHRRRGRR